MFRKQDFTDKQLYQAVKARFKANKLEALANMENLFEQPVGVAEHPNIVETLSSLAEDLANAQDVLNCLENYFENKPE